MSNDMRVVKFRMLVGDIYEAMGNKSLSDTFLADDSGHYLNEGHRAVWLAVVYDYNKLNEYGKIIMEQVSEMTDKDKKEDGDAFSHQAKFIEKCQDIEYRMKAAKTIVVNLNKDRSVFYGEPEDPLKLHFLFWALMILAVDDTDKEGHLSLICDFAKMLKVSDDDMTDMVRIIRRIYNIEGENELQKRGMFSVFSRVFSVVIHKYGMTDMQDEV